MAHPLLTRVTQAWPLASWQEVRVVVAVSGGADSVALLRALAQIRLGSSGAGDLIVAHYNHHCRGEASRQDAQWVAKLSEQLDLTFFGGESSSQGERSEATLRDERRAFYHQASGHFGARYLATGHTAGDQAETVLFRALRGSGLAGIAGISQFAQLNEATTLARPLLACTRDELVEYLDSLGQTWRTDATNEQTQPTRNWLRHDLLPLTEERFPGASLALGRLAQQAAEAEHLVGDLARQLLEQSAETAPNAEGVALRASTLVAAEPLVAREVIRLAWRSQQWPEQAMTAGHWQALLALARAEGPSARVSFPGSIDARCESGLLVLAPLTR